jgi:hypothetical protein
MITFIKNNFGELLISCLVIMVIATFVVNLYYRESKIVNGVVLEHGVTSDKYGDRTYITIIKTDDGFIEEKTGLNWYVTPINQQVSIKVHRWKKVNFKI